MKPAQKIISLFLACLMIFSVMAPVVTAHAAYENDLPIIYIKGNGRTVYNKNGKKISPTPSIANKIQDDENSAAISNAYFKSNDKNGYAPLKEEIRKIIDPIYKDLVLDANGNVSNGSYPQKNPTPKKKTSNFKLEDYSFEYDPRIDPSATATQLQSHINAVLKATGKKKVQLVSRCMGTAVAAAYLTKYGSGKVDTCVLYAGAMKGLLPISATFAGDFNIDYTALRKYSQTNMEDEFADIIPALTFILGILDPIGIAKGLLNSKIQKVATAIMPELIMATYGTMPAYWALVGEEYFLDAKEFVFGSQTAKYAGLIKKIDNYHYNVQRKLETTLTNLQKKGMKVAIISKYNVSLPPLFTYGKQQADGLVELNKMSLGATCTEIDKILSTNYISYVYNTGKGKYLSKDLMIDASTCLFPDYTWFIKGCNHNNWASSIHSLIYAILHSKKQYTVTTGSKYPQFLQYKSNKLTPITTGESLIPVNPTVKSYSLASTSYAYTGNDVKPYTIIRDQNGNELKKGRDYTATYDADCKSTGTHKVVIKMKGYYSGSKTLSYKIVPAKVSGVKATTSINSVKLTWSKVTGATGYRVQRYDSASGEWKTLKNTTSTSYTNSSLKLNTSYKYRIAAYRTANGKTVYGSNCTTVTAKTVPNQVSGLKAAGSPTSVKLTWSKVSNVTGYQVQRYNSSSKKWVTLATTANNYYTNSGLTLNTTYKYRVAAYKTVSGKKYYGTYSATASAKTIPADVKNLKATPSTTSIKLTWSKVSGATGYRVHKYNSSTKKWVTIKDITSTSYTFSKLTTGTAYKYAVTAYTKSGSKKAWASSVFIDTCTKPATPTLKLTAAAQQATASWSKVKGTGYEIYMATKKDGTYSKIKTVTSASTVSFKKTGLKTGQTYYFKVRAYKTNGSAKAYSAYSAVKSVKVK
ncbi:MAG: fibronectin type III domain-containing protein [Ruminococcus sp.]|nr:fibronectin type III domain-containing protein [Ruminococcus sp.]